MPPGQRVSIIGVYRSVVTAADDVDPGILPGRAAVGRDLKHATVVVILAICFKAIAVPEGERGADQTGGRDGDWVRSDECFVGDIAQIGREGTEGTGVTCRCHGGPAAAARHALQDDRGEDTERAASLKVSFTGVAMHAGVSVGVAVAVAVAVGAGDAVGVAVGDAVGVAGDAVGVAVGDAVGVGVGVSVEHGASHTATPTGRKRFEVRVNSKLPVTSSTI